METGIAFPDKELNEHLAKKTFKCSFRKAAKGEIPKVMTPEFG